MKKGNFDYYYEKVSGQFEYVEVPKFLYFDSRFKNISQNAKFLYSLILQDFKYAEKKNVIDENERSYVIFDTKHFESELGFNVSDSEKALRELLKANIIEVQKTSEEQRIYIKQH